MPRVKEFEIGESYFPFYGLRRLRPNPDPHIIGSSRKFRLADIGTGRVDLAFMEIDNPGTRLLATNGFRDVTAVPFNRAIGELQIVLQDLITQPDLWCVLNIWNTDLELVAKNSDFPRGDNRALFYRFAERGRRNFDHLATSTKLPLLERIVLGFEPHRRYHPKPSVLK